ncbi:cation transporter [Sphingomonas oleivorans]|uniref:Cation transporter n=1 Tax=Sphingomonas oleivorans TaxID=1735121 RepID=A0A2T5FZQ3_9SPHN|nr:cation transporter [Sphingomonas oleivorans]PTQ12186.1 cation transporter [Sphingomonas oleivorans]
MTTALLPWSKFLICALLIGLAGPVLTRSGDAIARLTGLSRSWIGLVLLATATSLPELFTGISAVAAAGAPNIAVGDALGSCVFNLLLLVLLDALSRDEPVYRRVDQGHILTAAFGIILIGFVGAFLLIGRGALDIRLGHVSIYTPFLILLYFVAMRAAFFYERRAGTIAFTGEKGTETGLAGAVGRYLAAASIVVGAGVWLPFAGLEIAEVMGWRASFVGTLFIAAATSLPELVVIVAALRLGAVDMAVANLLGSNLFDVLVIAIDDIAYTDGSLLASASPAHAGSAFAAVIMSGIVIVALLYRPGARFLGIIGWISLSLLVVYLLSSYAIYLLGH